MSRRSLTWLSRCLNTTRYYSECRGADRRSTAHPSDKSQKQSADSAKVIAAATSNATKTKFCFEYGTVPLLLFPEFQKFTF
jgi:hypothetical protein